MFKPARSLAFALLSVASAVALAVYATCSAARCRVSRIAANIFYGPVEMTATPEVKQPVFRVQARAFVAAIVQRRRPMFTASWRLCPST